MMNFDNITRIAYLGPNDSYAEIAKDYFCNKYDINADNNPLQTIKEIVDFVQDNKNVLGVLPMENSIIGTLREPLDVLMNSNNPNIKILAETLIPIKHCLLSKTTELYSITGIISSPQTLGQCRQYILNEMPRNLNIIEAASDSEAAISLSNYNLTYASIGSEKIAEKYNLNVLKDSINDDKSNRTSYILIGDYETEPTGHDKTTIMFTTKNKPGALMEILNIFSTNNVNLSHISSRQAKDNHENYIFTVSCDGHIRRSKIMSTLSQIKEKADYMKFLGSY